MGNGRDRLLMVALIAIVAVLALVSTPSEETNQGDPRLSTFRVTANGADALYRTLEAVEIPVHRSVLPVETEDTVRGPLALLAPSQTLTPAELRRMKSWVRGGGAVIYAARLEDPVLDSLGLVLESLAPDTGAARRLSWPGVRGVPAAHRWTAGVPPVEGFRYAFSDSSPALGEGVEILASTPDGAALVVAFRVGAGRIVAWSDAAPLANRTLRRSGAATIFARVAAGLMEEGERLRFDEYHHGYRGGGSPLAASLRFLRETAAGRMALQLAVVGVGLLLLLGRRFGSPLAPPPARRRSPLEHVEALAGAYRQAGARKTARGLLVAGLARRLRRSPREMRDADEFLARLRTRLPVGREAAGELEEEWRRGDGADLVRLSRGVDRLLEEVRAP